MEVKRLNIFDFDQTLVKLIVDWSGLKKSFFECASQFIKNQNNNNFLQYYFYAKSSLSNREMNVLNSLVEDFELQCIEENQLIESTSRLTYQSPYIIVSHNNHKTIEKNIEKFKLSNPMKIFGKDDMSSAKYESPEIISYIASLNIREDNIRVYGDSSDDERLAKKLNVEFINVNSI